MLLSLTFPWISLKENRKGHLFQIQIAKDYFGSLFGLVFFAVPA